MKSNEIVEIKNSIVYFYVYHRNKIYVAKVDESDWYKISRYRWCVTYNTKENRITGLKTSDPWTKLHRFVLNITDPKILIDHKNGDVLDNTKENLRTCSPGENARNIKSDRKNSKTGIKGITWHKSSKKWAAQIQINNKRIWLGTFPSKEDAINAYERAAKEHFGKFKRETSW